MVIEWLVNRPLTRARSIGKLVLKKPTHKHAQGLETEVGYLSIVYNIIQLGVFGNSSADEEAGFTCSDLPLPSAAFVWAGGIRVWQEADRGHRYKRESRTNVSS